jgi:hypothetical protein
MVDNNLNSYFLLHYFEFLTDFCIIEMHTKIAQYYHTLQYRDFHMTCRVSIPRGKFIIDRLPCASFHHHTFAPPHAPAFQLVLVTCPSPHSNPAEKHAQKLNSENICTK